MCRQTLSCFSCWKRFPRSARLAIPILCKELLTNLLETLHLLAILVVLLSSMAAIWKALNSCLKSDRSSAAVDEYHQGHMLMFEKFLQCEIRLVCTISLWNRPYKWPTHSSLERSLLALSGLQYGCEECFFGYGRKPLWLCSLLHCI